MFPATPQVNLRHGMAYDGHDKTTCTACAGTLIMEFAALSRLTGNPEYEVGVATMVM